MFRLRRRQRLVLPISKPQSEKKLKRESRCLTWANVALGALIPLMIGIGTTVITAVNEKLEDRRRQRDQDLAYLRRLQDQQIANWTREQDQQQVHELYNQGVYKTYVEDVSNVLFKSNNSFIDNEKKMKYIRTKTLTALDELDSEHKSRLLLFLYETGLLSPWPLPSENWNTTEMSLDLSGANFANISIKSTSHKKFHFSNLYLPSVDLTNASFIECQFNQGVDFSDSSMFGAKFTRSKFGCSKRYTRYNDPLGKIHVKFDRSNLERSDFSDSHICDISFDQANLAYSNFNGIIFQGPIRFRGTNLTKINEDQALYRVRSVRPLSLDFFNIDFRTVPLNMELFDPFMLSSSKMNNVILHNGTWIVDESNLILNGDAETSCLSLLDKNILPNWDTVLHQNFSFPTLSNDILRRHGGRECLMDNIELHIRQGR